MTSMLARLGVAVVVFASTNLDDLFLLAAFFADPRMRPRAVVAGQFLGIGALVAASAAAALAALAVPEGYPSLLGVVPLVLGLRKLGDLRRGAREEEDDDDLGPGAAAQRTRSQALAVGAVTIANGGDNLAVYIPLFASEPAFVPFYAGVFGAMTALWCIAAHGLVQNRVFGAHVRRYGHRILPAVLIGLGLWILSGARVLLE